MNNDSYKVLKDISNGYNPSTFEHYVCSEFIEYLEVTSNSHIIAHGLNDGLQEVEPHDFGYPHRYTEKYIKGRFAKLYLLDEWYQKEKRPLTFLTMTGYHKQEAMFSLENNLVNEIKDTFDRLQKGKRLFMRELYHMGFKGVPYIMVVEPHESGFPHYHMIVFASFTDNQRIRLRKCWEKWEIGSFEHGLDFDERPQKENIKSMRNYLMKYMAKSFVDYRSKYQESPWTKEQLLFNAIAWKYRYRTWCASNNLSKVMAYHPEKVEDITWYETTLTTDTCEHLVIWKNEDRIDTLKAEVQELYDKLRRGIIHPVEYQYLPEGHNIDGRGNPDNVSGKRQGSKHNL